MSAHRAAVLKIAPPYDDGLVRRIEQGFSEKLGTAVQFEVVEEPALLCGFVAYVRGTVYDMSGMTQMEGLRTHLMDSILVPPPTEAEEEEEEEGDAS